MFHSLQELPTWILAGLGLALITTVVICFVYTLQGTKNPKERETVYVETRQLQEYMTEIFDTIQQRIQAAGKVVLPFINSVIRALEYFEDKTEMTVTAIKMIYEKVVAAFQKVQESQPTMAEMPNKIDTPSEPEQEVLVTGMNQLNVVGGSTETCQYDSTEPPRTTGRKPGDEPGDVGTSHVMMTNTTDGRPLAAVQPSVFREPESQVTSEPSQHSTQQLSQGDSTSGPGQEAGARFQDAQSESGGVTSSTPPSPKQEIDILLIGKTGHGKSSTGNSILNRNEFKTSNKSTSATYDVHQAWTDIDDYIVKVIDGPGVAETRLESAEAAQKACDDMAKAMSLCPKGFHALLLVLKFGERFTREEEDCIAMLKSIFGQNIVRDYCVIVITHGELFDMEDDCDDFSDWLAEQEGPLKKLFIECSYRCVLMRNKSKKKTVQETQLRELVETLHTMKYREIRYTNELFTSVQQERNRLVVEVKAPQLKEEIMRDTNLILSDLTKLKDNNDDLDEVDTIVLRMEERAVDLIERINTEDNHTGVLGELKNTVSSLQESIKIEKAINKQRKEDRKIQDQLIKEHEENIVRLKVQHAAEQNKLEEQLRIASDAEKMDQLNSTFNQKMDEAKREEAKKWQTVLDETRVKHSQQMAALQSQYQKTKATNAEAIKNIHALSESQSTMAQMPDNIDALPEPVQSHNHEQEVLVTGMNQQNVLGDRTDVCQYDNELPPRTIGKKPGDMSDAAESCHELASTAETFNKTVTGSGDVPEPYETIHSIILEAREMDSSWSIRDQENKSLPETEKNVDTSSTTSDLPVTSGEETVLKLKQFTNMTTKDTSISAADMEGNLHNASVHHSVFQGNKENVHFLISQGADVKVKDYKGWTPLHRSARQGDKEIVEILIGLGADVDVKDKDGWSPLHASAQKGHKEMVELLIRHGADVDVKDEDIWTPLHWSASQGHKEIVELLIRHGADVNVKDDDKWTPLHWSARQGHKELIELLIRHGADVNIKDEDGWTPLHWSARQCHKELIELLIRQGADVNVKDENGWSPLHASAQEGHKEMVELLIRHGADVDVKDEDRWTPLHWSALKGHKEIAELLIRHGADVDVEDEEEWTPLHASAFQGHKEIVEILIRHGADLDVVDKDGWTPLHASAQEGHKEIVELLISHGADVDVKDISGKTALHESEDSGHQEIVELLIRHGADPSVKTLHGRTPLHESAHRGYHEIVDVLIRHGADVDVKDKEGQTPLHKSAHGGHQEVVKLLLYHGASVNVKDENGRTPLHLAAVEEREETFVNHYIFDKSSLYPGGQKKKTSLLKIVQPLIECGADIFSVDVQGETPLQMAERHGRKDFVDILKQARFSTERGRGFRRGIMETVQAMKRMSKVGITYLHYTTACGLSHGGATLNELLVDLKKSLSLEERLGFQKLRHQLLSGRLLCKISQLPAFLLGSCPHIWEAYADVRSMKLWPGECGDLLKSLIFLTINSQDWLLGCPSNSASANTKWDRLSGMIYDCVDHLFGAREHVDAKNINIISNGVLDETSKTQDTFMHLYGGVSNGGDPNRYDIGSGLKQPTVGGKMDERIDVNTTTDRLDDMMNRASHNGQEPVKPEASQQGATLESHDDSMRNEGKTSEWVESAERVSCEPQPSAQESDAKPEKKLGANIEEMNMSQDVKNDNRRDGTGEEYEMEQDPNEMIGQCDNNDCHETIDVKTFTMQAEVMEPEDSRDTDVQMSHGKAASFSDDRQKYVEKSVEEIAADDSCYSSKNDVTLLDSSKQKLKLSSETFGPVEQISDKNGQTSVHSGRDSTVKGFHMKLETQKENQNVVMPNNLVHDYNPSSRPNSFPYDEVEMTKSRVKAISRSLKEEGDFGQPDDSRSPQLSDNIRISSLQKLSADGKLSEPWYKDMYSLRRSFTQQNLLMYPVDRFGSTYTPRKHPTQILGIPWDEFERETMRLASFSRYPMDANKSSSLLAESGFVYIGNGRNDKVICFYCHLEKENWRLHEDIGEVHKAGSPHCPMVIMLTSNNNATTTEASAAASSARAVTYSSLAGHTRGFSSLPSSYASAGVEDEVDIPPRGRRPPTSMPHVQAGQQSIGNTSSATPFTTNGASATVRHQAQAGGEFPNRGTHQQQQSSQQATQNHQDERQEDSQQNRFNHPNINSQIYSIPRNPDTSDNSSSSTTTTSQSAQAVNGSNSTTVNSQQPRSLNYRDLGILCERPKHPELAVIVNRVMTYDGWPQDHHLRPDDLAKAGFHYAGYSDCCKCFFCGGGLRKWDLEDDPYVEHARWFPKCGYIRQLLGDDFIVAVQELKAEGHLTITMAMVKNLMGIRGMDLKNQFDDGKVEDDAAVKSLIDEGYDRDLVYRVASALKSDGVPLSADVILEKINVTNPSASTVAGVDVPDSVGADSGRNNADDEDIQELKDQNYTLRNNLICKICMDKEVRMVFLPCGHLVSCQECAVALQDCPVCRKHIRATVRASIR